MTTVRHICNGHEYRYDTDTGAVVNNYGTHVASLSFCKFTGIALLRHTLPVTRGNDEASRLIASLRGKSGMSAATDYTDEELARFAIGEVAANMPS